MNNNNNNILLLQQVDRLVDRVALLSSSSSMVCLRAPFQPKHMIKIAEFTDGGPVPLTILNLKNAAITWFLFNLNITDVAQVPAGTMGAFSIQPEKMKDWTTLNDHVIISMKPSTVYLFTADIGGIFFNPTAAAAGSTTTTTTILYFSNMKEFMYQISTMYLKRDDSSRETVRAYITDISDMGTPPTCQPTAAVAAIAVMIITTPATAKP